VPECARLNITKATQLPEKQGDCKMSNKLKTPYTEINGEKHITFPSGLAKLMAHQEVINNPAKVKTKEPLNVTSQIEEFFKKGGTIKEIPPTDRSVPEWTWWQDNYPKNYRR